MGRLNSAGTPALPGKRSPSLPSLIQPAARIAADNVSLSLPVCHCWLYPGLTLSRTTCDLPCSRLVYKKNHWPHEAPLAIKDAQGKLWRNPNKITVNQHVIPQAHLKEWLRPDGLLNVFDKQNEVWITPLPEHAFAVQRLWDQRTEQTLLGTNEANYQAQAGLVKASQPIEHHEHISAYFLMLRIRAEVASVARPDCTSMIVESEPVPTQAELEEVELQNVGSSVHMSYPGGDGSQAQARDVVAIMMNMKFLKGITSFNGMTWKQFDMMNEAAVFPDSFSQMQQSDLAILPVTPRIVLIGTATEQRLMGGGELTPAVINRALLGSSVRHYVAADQAGR